MDVKKGRTGIVEYPYFDFYSKNGSDISFEVWTDTRGVGLHKHEYYEILLVSSGSCRHIYKNVETLLLPGDAVLISAHQEHGYSPNGKIEIYNCQFMTDSIEPDLLELLNAGESLFENLHISQKEILNVLEESFGNREEYYKEGLYNHTNYEVNSNKQGVIHLSPAEVTFVKTMLDNGLEAHKRLGREENLDDSQKLDGMMQKKSLEMILLYLKKAQNRQNQQYMIHSKANQRAIAGVLHYIDQHLGEKMDFNQVAEMCSFTPNYFRKIFKDVTGFSPVNYVNRMRIMRASEYIQKGKMPIKKAAEMVGIYDLNYFSRLFKKIMGFAPSKL